MILETVPRVRIPLRQRREKVTVRIEGLNFNVTESHFLERFGRFRRGRLNKGHYGIVGIEFNYETKEDTYILGGTRLVSSGAATSSSRSVVSGWP